MGAEESRGREERIAMEDPFAELLGIEVEEASEDLSRVTAVVRAEHLNRHNTAHGGFVFTLADAAFALTVNARSVAVAVQWSLSQYRSAALGERLTAECRLLHGGRRLRVVELVVSNGDGRVLAKGQATAIPLEGSRAQA